MGKHNTSNAVLCPYYRGDERSKIYCRGEELGASLIMTFASPGNRLEYQRQRCKSYDYRLCCVAMANESITERKKG